MCFNSGSSRAPTDEEHGGAGLLDVMPFLLASLVSCELRLPVQLRILCKESLRLFDAAQPSVWVNFLPSCPWAPSDALRSFKDMIRRGCAPKKLCIKSNRGDDLDEKSPDITEALLSTLACFSGPQLQLSELCIHGPCQLTPALAAALTATTPRLAALCLVGPAAETAARGPADGLVALVSQLPCLERLTLSESAYQCFDRRTVLSASVCRALRGGEDVSVDGGADNDTSSSDLGGSPRVLQEPLVWEHLTVAAACSDKPRVPLTVAAWMADSPPALRRASPRGGADLRAIRHLELSFMDPISVLAALEGCSQLQSLNVISHLRRCRGDGGTGGVGGSVNPKARAALRGLGSLKSLNCLILGEFGSGAGGRSCLPLVPTLASLPSLRSLILPMWRLGLADLQSLSLLTALEQLTIAAIDPTGQGLAAQTQIAAAGGVAAAAAAPPPPPPSAHDSAAVPTAAGDLCDPLLRRYVLPPRLQCLMLLHSMSVRKLYMLQPASEVAAGAAGKYADEVAGGSAVKPSPPPPTVWMQQTPVRLSASHVSPNSNYLKSVVLQWFSGAVQLLRLRCASRPPWPSTGPGDSLSYLSATTNAAAAATPQQAELPPPPNRRLVVEGLTGRYLRGPPEVAPLASLSLTSSAGALPDVDRAVATTTAAAVAAAIAGSGIAGGKATEGTTVPGGGGGHHIWLHTMVPLNLASLELKWLALSTYDLDTITRCLPNLKALGLARCVYPLQSLPRLAALPSLELLLLECAWWPAGAGAEAMAAEALVELCRRAASLRRCGLPCRKLDEYSVPLVSMSPLTPPLQRRGGASTSASDGGAGAARASEVCGDHDGDDDDAPCIYGSASSSGVRGRVAAAVANAARVALAAEGMDPERVRMEVSTLWG